MKAVHFGAGNIGRGFIGEVLHKNNIEVVFVDINKEVIDALNDKQTYEIELAAPGAETIQIKEVRGVNNQTDPDQVAAEIVDADIITTAIGPNILPFIAPLIAEGLKQRLADDNHSPLDVIACENMIGGSEKLQEYVFEHLSADEITTLKEFVGFPNAAVDRIIPMQSHEDPLFVSVEPFSEWIIDESQMKNKALKLDGVNYAASLEPYIERKLLSVNTGHATVAYASKLLGHETIDAGISDGAVLDQLKKVLGETGDLLIHKWNFDKTEHKAYQEKVVERFQNPYISDDVVRVGRTPIRKLGYNERFILPIRELAERELDYTNLVDTVGMIFHYDDPADDESVKLQTLLKEQPVVDIIKQVTGLTDEKLVHEIREAIEKY